VVKINALRATERQPAVLRWELNRLWSAVYRRRRGQRVGLSR